MEIDVHGMLRLNAKQYILESIDKCYKNGDTSLKVIHGSNHGTVIRDWLRGSKTLGDKVLEVTPFILNESDITIIKIKKKR